MWLINLGLLLVAAALLLTLWKLYLSINELNHVEQVNQMHVHSHA